MYANCVLAVIVAHRQTWCLGLISDPAKSRQYAVCGCLLQPL